MMSKEQKKKKIVFITGTRADFGKLKSLMRVIEESEEFECYIFVTGMHTLSKYGSTYKEVVKEGFKNIYVYINQTDYTPMDIILANTIIGFHNYVNEIKPDLIVVHGDRVETLAGAIVGAFNNIRVAHIEGGEVSGTIDESIRHAITKLAHLHFVANEEAKNRVRQLGESEDTIFVIGSPEIDIMLSDKLPSIEEAKKRYGIPFDRYAILIYHPVTTELDRLDRDIKEVVDAVIESEKNYIVIYPNNDPGSEVILKEYNRLEDNDRFRIFPSIRFEYFLTLLKHCVFIIGNSSVGVRQAEVYGIPSINIGTRQKNRRKNSKAIINVNPNKREILEAIKKAEKMERVTPELYFGNGNSAKRFYEVLKNPNTWKLPYQKFFVDVDNL